MTGPTEALPPEAREKLLTDQQRGPGTCAEEWNPLGCAFSRIRTLGRWAEDPERAEVAIRLAVTGIERYGEAQRRAGIEAAAKAVCLGCRNELPIADATYGRGVAGRYHHPANPEIEPLRACHSVAIRALLATPTSSRPTGTEGGHNE